MKRWIPRSLIGLIFAGLLAGCTSTVYVPSPPPAARVEVKSSRPGPNYVWIDGHWKWNGRRYAWVDGHWNKKKAGHWVPGHWTKRPRGWVYVPGHWK